MGNTKLNMEILNASDESIKSLFKEITSLKMINLTHNKNLFKLELEYPNDQDPREELFNYAIKSNWIILEMSPKSINLESVFRTLTMEGKDNA